MSPRIRLALVAVIVVVIVAVGGLYLLNNRSGTSAIDQATPTADATTPAAPAATATEDTGNKLMQPGPFGERSLGDPKAPNVVVEYASLTCPHCQRFATTVFPEFKTKYIDTGKVYYIYRPFSLNDLDTAAIMLTFCVPQERFFPLVDLLYQRQPEWVVQNPVPALQNVVKQAGISEDDFNTCLKNQTILGGVTEIRDRASKEFGVDSTPTFFVNGTAHPGEQSLEDLDKLLAG